jgi:hypothetical protein
VARSTGVGAVRHTVCIVIRRTPKGGNAAMSNYIARRDDVNPEQGIREHGDVEFADPTNNKYPLENAGHVRSAWSYINQKDNAAKYAPDEVETIKNRIKRAAKKHGVEITAD